MYLRLSPVELVLVVAVRVFFFLFRFRFACNIAIISPKSDCTHTANGVYARARTHVGMLVSFSHRTH